MANVEHSLGVAAPDQKTEKTGNYTVDNYSAAQLRSCRGFCDFAYSLVFILIVAEAINLILIVISDFVQNLCWSTTCAVASFGTAVLRFFPFSMRLESEAVRAAPRVLRVRGAVERC
jgi:hypothetical protein